MKRWGAALAALVLTLAPLAAQEQQNEFVPASSLQRSELAPAPLIYGAYAFVWAVLLIYVFFLWRRIARVERELTDVNHKLNTRR